MDFIAIPSSSSEAEVIKRSFSVEEDKDLVRLDQYLVRYNQDLTRTRLKSLILEGRVFVDGQKKIKPSEFVKPRQKIDLELPRLREAEPLPQPVPFGVVFEDQDLLVVNKPAGLVVHPAPGNPDRTLVNGLLAHCYQTLSGISGVKRPGIVHRLDKGTSGLMVVAKNDEAHHFLAAQFSDRTLSRGYMALVWGVPCPLKGHIESFIGRSARHRQKMAVVQHKGKVAFTAYHVQQCFGTMASLLTCHLKTGRTHQIRVHLTHLGHPLLGDPLYGHRPKGLSADLSLQVQRMTKDEMRPALHAAELTFIHPRSHDVMHFKAAPPQDFLELQDLLQKLLT